jgi:hypothetical protein
MGDGEFSNENFRILQKFLPVFDDVVQTRADQSSDDRGHGDIAGHFRINPVATKLTAHHERWDQKAQHGHQAKTMESKRTDFKNLRVHRHHFKMRCIGGSSVSQWSMQLFGSVS